MPIYEDAAFGPEEIRHERVPSLLGMASREGAPDLEATTTVQHKDWSLGRVCWRGGDEFRYVQFIEARVAGDTVGLSFSGGEWRVSGTYAAIPGGVVMGSPSANDYGWIQTGGRAIASKVAAPAFAIDAYLDTDGTNNPGKLKVAESDARVYLARVAKAAAANTTTVDVLLAGLR